MLESTIDHTPDAGTPSTRRHAASRPAKPALGTSGSNAGELSRGRRSRHRLRRLAAEVSGAEHLHDCGRKAVRTGGGVGVRGTVGGGAGFSGVDTCGSWSSCPVCAAKIGASRADDLAQLLAWAVAQGHTVAMLTLTARHHRGDSLATLWDGLSGAWRHLGRGWGSETEAGFARRQEKHEQAWADYRAGVRRRPRALKGRRIGIAEQAGMLGYVRATESTVGDASGWHVHYHVVLVLDSAALPAGVEDREAALDLFRRRVYALWAAGLRKSGLSAVETVQEKDGTTSYVGADLRIMHGTNVEAEVGRYLTKMTDAEAGYKAARALAGEATLGQFKTGRSGNRSPFEVLGAVAEHGLADDADLWQEWVRVSRGRVQMVWSRALRAMAGLAEEARADEDIAAEEAGDVDLVVLPRETWLEVRDDLDARCAILEAVERGGRERLMRELDRRGLHYLPCDDDGRPLGY